MKALLFALLAASLALVPLTAAGQDAAPTAAATPAAAAKPVDPQRLAAARITVDHIFPAGTYARIMNGNMNVMLDSIAKTSSQLPLQQVAALAGQSPTEIAKLGKTTLADIMAIYDPVHDQRMGIVMHTTMTAMAGIMAQLEPSIRDGLAQAYAERFTASQLADMNRFFDTPSGQAYAANALSIQTNPAVMAKMQAIVPVLLQRLPAIMDQASQAAAKLPPPRKFADLSPAERVKLAGLLGVPEAQLEANAAKK